jgi:phage tail sheath protein FI
MPVQVSYPGVYIQEVSSGSRTITGVSTSVALFVGMADEGPMDTPVRTSSYTEFERNFGVTNDSGELHDQVSQFFGNGGQTAWVIRIADGADAAAVQLNAEDKTTAVLTITAAGPGTFGNSIRLHVDYDTPTPEATFNMKVDRLGLDSGGSLVVVTSETYKNLTMNPNSSKYVVDVLNQQSALVNAALEGTPSAVAAYSIWGVYETSDASTVLETHYTGGEGKFRISVDGSPFVTATLTTGMSAAQMTTAINTALAATGKSVTLARESIGASRFIYKLTSGQTGGLIQFAPADSKDISVDMEMGAANHGIDVGGWAHVRPAPNGLFAPLRVDSFALLDGKLFNLLTVVPNTIDEIDANDTIAALDVTVAGGAAHTSLGGVRGTLESVRDLINAAPAPFRWRAVIYGLRLVLLPEFGGNDAYHAGFITTGSALEAGGDNAYFGPTTSGNVHYYELGNFTTNRGGYQNGSAAGTNGAVPTAENYQAAWDLASREIDLYNIMVLPRSTGENENDRQARWGAASIAAKNRRAIVVVDPPPAWDSAQDVTSGIANLRVGVATDHAALYWPRIKISASGGTTRTIDPSGALAGIMARTDAARGVWKAPAGLEANLLGVRGVEYAINDADNGNINPQAVNAIRVFPNGIVSWGARTMVGFDNSGNDDYKYLPVRRLALYIEESLYRGLKWAVFEPNDAPLWRQLRASAGAFMNNLFRQGAFAGEKASDAYFVRCDASTTTQNDVNLGIVNVMIGFAPLKPAEFVVITLQQKAGEVQV